jgi:hypothetical protein
MPVERNAHALESTGAPGTPWSATQLFLFRCVFGYFALYSVDVLVFTVQTLFGPRNTAHYPPLLTGVLWDRLIPWVGQHLLHLQKPVVALNIGADLPFEYILRGTEIVLAFLAAFVWTALDRRRRNYTTLHGWLRIAVRMALAGVMLRYGLSKVLPLQFGTLTLHRLSTPLGELQPMGMLWAFMAASKGYTILSGVVETLGGLLLLFPELTALGALISAGAMANVFVLNVFYDVNQKVRSLSYLLLALFLLAPHMRRLIDVLVLNRRSDPVVEPHTASHRWLSVTLRFLPLIYGIFLLAAIVPRNVQAYAAMRHAEALHGENYGVWVVKTFTVGDATKPLLSPKLNAHWKLAPGQDRWQRLIVESGDDAMIQFGNGKWDHVEVRSGAPASNAAGPTILYDGDDPSWTCAVALRKTSADSLQMSGTINGNPVAAAFERDSPHGYSLSDPIRWMADGDRDY